MNLFNATPASLRTATGTANSRKAQATLSTQRYRSRDFGIGYGRSQGYARTHSLWSTGTKPARYC